MRSLPGIRNLSETEKNKQISAMETLFSSAGLQIKGFSQINEAYGIAEKYKKSVGIKEDTGAYPISKFQPMRYALEDGDIKSAQAHFDKLKAENPKESTAKLTEAFHIRSSTPSPAPRPKTGSSITPFRAVTR